MNEEKKFRRTVTSKVELVLREFPDAPCVYFDEVNLEELLCELLRRHFESLKIVFVDVTQKRNYNEEHWRKKVAEEKAVNEAMK